MRKTVENGDYLSKTFSKNLPRHMDMHVSGTRHKHNETFETPGLLDSVGVLANMSENCSCTEFGQAERQVWLSLNGASFLRFLFTNLTYFAFCSLTLDLF